MTYAGPRSKAAASPVCNTNAILNRELPILSSGELDLLEIFATKLSEVLMSPFKVNREMRLATDKAKLMQLVADVAQNNP